MTASAARAAGMLFATIAHFRASRPTYRVGPAHVGRALSAATLRLALAATMLVVGSLVSPLFAAEAVNPLAPMLLMEDEASFGGRTERFF